MKKFFANVWTKRVCSLASAFYAYCVCYLCYFSLFYDIHISAGTSLCLIVSAVSLVALVVMLYTRKQIITRISSFIILPAMLPVVLLYFGQWGLIIPIIVTGVAIMLLSGAGEGTKTALGTIILLMYIFGALGYFLFTSFFVTTVESTVIDSGVSKTGKYRYRVVNTVDASKGSTCVYIEPNDTDRNYPYVRFTLKNMEHVAALERPVLEEAKVEWTTLTRKEISSQLAGLSEHIRVNLSESDRQLIGYNAPNKYVLTLLSSTQKERLGRKPSDMSVIMLDDLSDYQLTVIGLKKDENGRYYSADAPEDMLKALGKKAGDRVYITELSERQLKYFNVEIDTAVYLSDLTDAQLALLGIPESGDVMTLNGKVCFRYYVAELENYFDTESRRISINILG